MRLSPRSRGPEKAPPLQDGLTAPGVGAPYEELISNDVEAHQRITEVQGPTEFNPDKTDVKISDQIREGAKEYGRHDLNGLSWQHVDDSYEVVARNKIHTVTDTKFEPLKKGEKGFTHNGYTEDGRDYRYETHDPMDHNYDPGGKWHDKDPRVAHRDGRRRDIAKLNLHGFGPLQFGRRKYPEGVHGDESLLTVERRNQFGEITHVYNTTESELFNYFDTLTGDNEPRGVRDTRLKEVTWKARGPEDQPANKEEIAVPISADSKKDQLDQVNEFLEQRNITNMEGFTLDSGNFTVEVIKNGSMTRTKENLYTEEVVPFHVLRVSNPGKGHRTEEIRILEGDEFRDYLASINLSSANNPRFYRDKATTPEPVFTPEENAQREHALEDIVTRDFEPNPDSATGPDIFYNHKKGAIWLLSGVDRLPEDVDHATRLHMLRNVVQHNDIPKEVRNHPAMKAVVKEREKRMEVVEEMIADKGLAETMELAGKLQEEYEEAAKRLRLAPSKNENAGSIKWAVESLADQYYYDKNPDKIADAGEAYEGINFSDPFENTAEASKRRREMIDRHIGLLMANTLIKPITVNEPEPNAIGDPKRNKEGKPIIKQRLELSLDENRLAGLSKSVKHPPKRLKDGKEYIESNAFDEAIKDIFKHRKNHLPEPLAELEEIGRRMRRLIQQ